MSRWDWLTARPIAHRGLHDPATGIIENSASAASAAVAGNYGIETDLQIAGDGEAMVFHDDTLDRLTAGAGPVASVTAAALKQVRYRGSDDTILTLGDLCDLVGGRTPLVIELKSRFDGDIRLVRRTVEVLRGYRGPVAVMSFDPDPIAALRELAPQIARGIVAERYYRHPDWKMLTPARKRQLAFLLHALRSRPQFLAYNVNDLPSLPSGVARTVFGLPLLTWTVRSDANLARARRHADQIIFEGFRA
jgi:glycerophosphoryl diester phosphodiesterase